MNEHAIAEMAAREDDHWWYVGLRDLLGRLSTSPRFAPPPFPRVLDAGCGTGATLRFLRERLRPAYLGGFDHDPRCLAAAQEKCPLAHIYAADFGEPTFSSPQFDWIVSCDVISYVDPAARLEGLRRLGERLTPEGRLVLHAPACPSLYSRHDREVGTRERFTAAGLRALIEGAGLTIELLTYRMSLLFPVTAMQRRATRDAATTGVSDLQRGGRFIGAACRSVLTVENVAIAHGVRFPIGSSLLVVARRSPALVGAEKGRGPAWGPRPELTHASS